MVNVVVERRVNTLEFWSCSGYCRDDSDDDGPTPRTEDSKSSLISHLSGLFGFIIEMNTGGIGFGAIDNPLVKGRSLPNDICSVNELDILHSERSAQVGQSCR